MRKVTGQIDEGWLGEDQSSKERANGGSDYVLDVVIGPTCKMSFQVVARSIDEAKGIIRSFLQWRVDWDEEPKTPIELFWYEVVPASHRSLSEQDRVWLARHVENFGEEKTKSAIMTAAKRIEFGKFPTTSDLTRYVGGILKNSAKQKATDAVRLKGTATTEHAWEPKPNPSAAVTPR